VVARGISIATSSSARILRTDTVALLTFYLFLLIAIPSRLVFAPLGGGGTPASLVGIAFLGWYLLAWLNPTSSLDRTRQPIRVAGVLFFATIIASYVSATRHTLPTVELNAADRNLIVGAGWLGVLLLTADGIDSMDRLRTLLQRMVFGASAMAALGIIQFFGRIDLARYIYVPGLSTITLYSALQQFQGFPRPTATAIQPLEFAAVLAMILPLAIHQARYAPPGRRGRRWFQVTLISAALPMTVSRTAILGIIVTLIILLPTWPRRDRGWAYITLIIGAMAARAVVPGLLGTIRNLFFAIGSDADTLSRTSAISASAPFIAQHPWFGRGFGTFLPQVYRFLDNQWLGTLIELGIVGALVLLGIFLTGWSLARRARRATVDGELRDLAQSVAAAVAVAAVLFGTFDALGFPMATGIAFLVLGCAGALWRLVRTQEDGLAPVGPEGFSRLHS
jgi:polysaccharide biosynthesis protein PslJ